MKLLLATPLYPPDIAEPAPYIKELAKRLSAHHEVTVVTYGRLPEQVEGVRIVTIDKRRPLLLRLIAYTIALARAVRNADLVYVENGASVELPAGIVSRFSSKPFVLHLGDTSAHARTASHPLLRSIESFFKSHANKVLTSSPLSRPEILPFSELPDGAQNAYEVSWHEHMEALETIFSYEKK